MPANALVQLLPDLVLLVRRDGVILARAGGSGVVGLNVRTNASADTLETAWPEATAALIKQLVRKAITGRMPTEAQFPEGGKQYEARVTPQGPDRAICLIRPVIASPQDDSADATGERARPELDRRGFMHRLKESMAMAALREKSIAVAVVYVDGIPDIAQFITAKISEQVMSLAIMRLAVTMGDGASSNPKWYLGQLGENVVALVVESSDRDAVDVCVSRACESLREPVRLNGTEFRLVPYAGVAILGLDSPSHKTLLDHARDAAAEARRTASNRVFFFSDTMQLKSLARLDVARELRGAIANGDIGFRYVGRHDLTTGRLAAWVGYLRWQHPLRGEIRPSEFLRVAETTGLAMSLSRSALSQLPADFARLSAQSDADADVRISFGALRDHILHEDFVIDIETFLAEGHIPAERLELRISEKSFVGRSPDDFHTFQRRNIQLVVDEIARDMGSLPWLARAPIWGLQLDRAWVTSLLTDDVARKVCRAGISVATSLGLTPIAIGVDTSELRDALLSLGCKHGSGDLYARI